MTKYQKVALTIFRVVFGVMFLLSGLDKLFSDFSATGFLVNATAGPFSEIYMSLAGSVFIDFLVVFGEISIGVALICGLLTRLASYMGALMMLLFYLAVLPPEHGFISEHIIYILVFVVFVAFAVGRYYGLDYYLEQTDFVKNNNYLRFLLG